jgi:hypothetical protein
MEIPAMRIENTSLRGGVHLGINAFYECVLRAVILPNPISAGQLERCPVLVFLIKLKDLVERPVQVGYSQ